MSAIWAIVPAGGLGRRMGSAQPKQYLSLAGRTILEHTIERLCAHPKVHAAVVAVAEHDRRFDALPIRERVLRARGGAERLDSVLGALEALRQRADDAKDWALVHDAVRPCLSALDLDRLITAALESDDGALLAVPVHDTIKRVRGDRVVETVPREALWRALTPQMFPLGLLRSALERARAGGLSVTDEAQAMERAGHAPRVVEGSAGNLKITRAGDLEIAAFHLSRIEASQ